MPPIPLTIGNYGRPRVGLPELRLVNCYPEATKEGPSETARIPRPGLTAWNTLGSGPILRQFQSPGLFNGDLFTISGGTLYRNATAIGSVAFTNQPRMAASLTQLAIVSGGALYVYDGTALTNIRFFDDGSSPLPSFSSVAVLFNIFVYTVSGSNQFFFSETGDATLINAANFSEVQTSPDPILEVVELADELWFLGSRTCEPWGFTGSLTAPFQLQQGRTYARGCAAQGSVVTKLDNTIFWIGDDLSVYRSSAVPIKVSTPFIDDRLRQAKDTIDQTYAFTVGIEGHRFYVINLAGLGESWALDVATNEWAQWGSLDPFSDEPTTFMGQTSAGEGAAIYVGSSTGGKVWTLDASTNTDDGSDRTVIFSGALWTIAGKHRLNNVGLQCVRGVGNALASDPKVEMRMSKDGGRTWGVWLAARLGKVGEYLVKAVWRNLGMISQPGVVFEWRIVDPVLTAIEGAAFNEARY